MTPAVPYTPISDPLAQWVQYIAWLLALVQLTIGLYVLLTNAPRPKNQLIAGLLVLLALNTFSAGQLSIAAHATEAYLPALVLAISAPMIPPLLLLVTAAMLLPGRLAGAWKWLRWIPLALILLPLALGLSDVILGTSFYFTPPASASLGDFSPVAAIGGELSGFVHLACTVLCSLGLFALLLYLILLDQGISWDDRRIALALLGANALSGAVALVMPQLSLSAISLLLSNALLFAAYTYAAFRQMASDDTMAGGSLQRRLIMLILATTLPLMIALALVLIDSAQKQIEDKALERLSRLNQSVADATTAWLEGNQRALHNLVISAEIRSMQAPRQMPLLENLAASYPEIQLVSITDTRGVNVARSDGGEPQDYSDFDWFQQAMDGQAVSYQPLIEPSSGQPALVVAMPIRDGRGQIAGVAMFASNLEQVSRLAAPAETSPGGVAYIVDQDNWLLAHPDPAQMNELQFLGADPAIQALRNGVTGMLRFTGVDGGAWLAYVDELENGWGIIAQQREWDLLAPVRAFRRVALIALAIAAGTLLIMATLTVRQGMRPIGALTETATAIIDGDLSVRAPVFAEDELGLLARALNNLADRLRGSIGELEVRVAERTADVERRAVQLQVMAEVAREAAAIRDPEKLLENVVQLISKRFGFYHAGIFLLSESEEEHKKPAYGRSRSRGFAVLRAASSPGGQRMLARGYRLKVGEEGIVGYTAGSGLPRIALNVGTDSVFFNHPDLPETLSEMALPLKIQERVIGVLDVQSTEAGAFDDEDIAILQILADQIALAIENARLLATSQQALQELEALLGQQARRGWQHRLAGENLTFAWDVSGVRLLAGAQSLRTAQVSRSDSLPGYAVQDGRQTLQMPIQLRGQRLGTLVLQRQAEQEPWSSEEQEIIQQTIEQVALALENARLLEEIQARAVREESINRLTAGIARTLDPERILRTTLSELGKLPGVVEASISVGPPDSAAPNPPTFDEAGNGRDERNRHESGQGGGEMA